MHAKLTLFVNSISLILPLRLACELMVQARGETVMLTKHQASGDHWTEGCRSVDLVHLSRQTLGNQELEREILKLFVKQSEIYLDRLKSATSNQAWRDAAHTIKGSARGVGAWEVVRFAEKAEQLEARAAKKPKAYVIDGLSQAINDANHYIEAVLADG
jgi:HPt (histidine-containing phosphotransfer) domain-containing protein